MSVKRPINLVEPLELPIESRKKHLNTIEPRIVLEGPRGDSVTTFGEWRRPISESHDSDNQQSQILKDSDGEDVNSSMEDILYDLPPLLITTSAVVGESACFGMIHNAKVNVLDADEFSCADFETVSEAPGIYQLQLSSTDHVFFVGTASIPHLAVMNEKISGALYDLSYKESCRFYVYMAAGNCASLQPKDFKTEKKIALHVDIVIYGPEMGKKSVGHLLSGKRIYLQHPCYRDPDAIYDNPHVLVITDLLASSLLSSPAISRTRTPSNDCDKTLAAYPETDDLNEPQVVLQRQVGKIFESLTRPQSLKRLEADIRVNTQLKRHQEEALDFMAQREFGSRSSQYSLWTTRQKSERIYYEHLITRIKTEDEPVETIGGILADDMGLGKTLTVLSTIIRTTSSAKQYAQVNVREGKPPKNDLHGGCQVYSRATLVVVPSPLLIDGWVQEMKSLESHCDGSLNIYVYHGRTRAVDLSVLANYDMVLTTYHTIAAEAVGSPLNNINWFRIVLDEAHIVRRMGTKLYQAVSMLSARFRWCLTGTPIQNRLEDLASLVAFIRCYPLDNMTEFRKNIISPVLKNGDQGLENMRLLLDSICLRRTRKLLHLPEITYNDQPIDFSPSEKAYYEETQTEMINAIKKIDSHGRKSKDFFGMFQLYLQLRRICNHGTYYRGLSNSHDDNQFEPGEVFELLERRRLAECTYCKLKITGLEDIEGDTLGKFSPCGHLFCLKCYTSYDASLKTTLGAELQCSICSRKVPRILPTSSDSHVGHRSFLVYQAPHPNFPEKATSSKINALIEDIQKSPSEGKSIIFSCWTRSLDLVAHHLSLQNIDYARIDGTYSLSQRQKILDEYQEDNQIRYLLMTTGTGAVGLNLTIANCIYLLEPQWNPMVEKQAIARVLRLGQHRNVKVTRYFVKETYEENMRSQQLRKLGFARHMDGSNVGDK
ncbi:hypothetical protein EG329_007920 [Mollisiaceae sp. DMI_Dod_QoI]|nr:hypothetical protein EG329_007920 [Helotiales sp. DMI_Dod_QoI]